MLEIIIDTIRHIHSDAGPYFIEESHNSSLNSVAHAKNRLFLAYLCIIFQHRSIGFKLGL
jgi:hypothetical protein